MSASPPRTLTSRANCDTLVTTGASWRPFSFNRPIISVGIEPQRLAGDSATIQVQPLKVGDRATGIEGSAEGGASPTLEDAASNMIRWKGGVQRSDHREVPTEIVRHHIPPWVWSYSAHPVKVAGVVLRVLGVGV